jgi:hypothetical protein
MFIELTVRNLLDIDRIISQIQELNPTHIGLTDKNGMPDNVLAASAIKKAIPNIRNTLIKLDSEDSLS